MIQFNQDKAPGVTCETADGLAAIADLPAAGAGAVHAIASGARHCRAAGAANGAAAPWQVLGYWRRYQIAQ